MKLFRRFFLSGLFNAFIGYSVIFLLIYLGYEHNISNFFGYLSGTIVSYFMSTLYVFEDKLSKYNMRKFIITIVLAYMLNLFVLNYLIYISFNSYLSQILSGIVFTISNFILQKNFVYKEQLIESSK